VPGLAERLEVQVGSHYAAPFACFLACSTDAVSTVKFSVELKKMLYLHRPNGTYMSR
jgi:hypothetical protein